MNFITEYLNTLKERRSPKGDLMYNLEKVVAVDKPFRVTRGNKGEVRIQPITRGEKLDQETVLKYVKLAGADVKEIVMPGHPKSMSGKFSTIITTDDVPIVIGSGGPLGLKHEENVAAELTDFVEGKSEPTPRVLNLLSGLSISPDELASVEHIPGKAASRPMAFSPSDVGEAIADITLVTVDGVRHFISLKDPTGETFANYGIRGSFRIVGNEVKTFSHPSDKFLDAVGLDKAKIAKGLEVRLAGTKPDFDVEDDHPDYDPELVKGFLQSAYGYGYWYVKAESPTDWQIIDLRTKADLAKLVGSPYVSRLFYPGITKQAKAVIVSGDKKFYAEVRNSKGGVEPTEVKVKTA